jgi:hypothetical protein
MQILIVNYEGLVRSEGGGKAWICVVETAKELSSYLKVIEFPVLETKVHS